MTELERIFADLLVVLEGRTDYALEVLKLWQRLIGNLEKEAAIIREKSHDIDRRLTALESHYGIAHSDAVNE